MPSRASSCSPKKPYLRNTCIIVATLSIPYIWLMTKSVNKILFKRRYFTLWGSGVHSTARSTRYKGATIAKQPAQHEKIIRSRVIPRRHGPQNGGATHTSLIFIVDVYSQTAIHLVIFFMSPAASSLLYISKEMLNQYMEVIMVFNISCTNCPRISVKECFFTIFTYRLLPTKNSSKYS